MKQLIPLLIVCSLLTGCTSMVGVKQRETDQYSVEQSTIEEASVESGENSIYVEETRKSLGDIAVSGETEDVISELIIPTKPTESTEESITYEETTVQDYYDLSQTYEETTVQQTEPETTKDWGESPTMYSSDFGEPAYRTDVSIPDVNGINKDTYGNYIIPYSMFSNRNNLPTNERGKIPYMFWYDELGNVLNPLPDDLNKYKEYFELGTYKNPENGLEQLIPTKSAK